MESDIGPFYLFIISVGTCLYSCANSLDLLFQFERDQKPDFLKLSESDKEEIGIKTVIIMLFSSSAVLVILFYIFRSIQLFFKLIILISCFFSTFSVSWDWVFFITNSRHSTIIAATISSAISLIWLVKEQWIATDFLAFCLCVQIISMIKIRRMQVVYFISIAFLIYDVYWVFISPAHFGGKSVMVETAKAMAPHVPAVFSVPREYGASMIGCGDIIMPSFCLDFFLRFDASHQTHFFELGLACYAAGVAISWAAVYLMGKGQPALLWIFPTILIPNGLYAVAIGKFKLLWDEGSNEYDKLCEDPEKDEKKSEASGESSREATPRESPQKID